MVKGAIKFGGHSWGATSSWFAKHYGVEAGQQVHHWLIPRNGWGKIVPNAIKNQPYNLMAMSKELHQEIHYGLTLFGKMWFGTPTWFKALGLSSLGRFANLLRGC